MTYRLEDDAKADDDEECEDSQEGKAFGNECDVSNVDKSAGEDILAQCQELGR